MNLYTKSGDHGETFVIGGRVNKDDARVEAYGTLDELNSFVGAAAACPVAAGPLREQLTTIMHELFDCGSDLAFTDSTGRQYKVTLEMASHLERWIDDYMAEAPPLTRFILPGGTELAAALHICRTVCRRAERRIVSFSHEAVVNEAVLVYINRLSDYFFAAARAVNARAGEPDIEYVRSAHVFRD